MLIWIRNVAWQAKMKSAWHKKLLYINCTHAFQLSYLNHSYSSPSLFSCVWLVILNKGKVACEMILKKSLLNARRFHFQCELQNMVKYFSRKSKCSFMLWSWWYKQVLINFAAHDDILLCCFFNSPCFQYILRNNRLGNFYPFECYFFEKKRWKIWFLPMQMGSRLIHI